MTTVHTEVLIDGITYTLAIAQDDLDVRGNALASGDDAEDRDAEDFILRRLDSGDVWAWAATRVTAEFTFEGETFEGVDYLGGCSYRDTADFIEPGGYYDDMKIQAKDDLERSIRAAVRHGEVAEAVISELVFSSVSNLT